MTTALVVASALLITGGLAVLWADFWNGLDQSISEIQQPKEEES